MTRVSVIISSYNAPERLKRAVGSVLNQTHDDIELIVCDDGSVNLELLHVLDGFESDGHKVIRGDVVSPEEKATRCTFAELINRGLDEATGGYISYLCDGDEYNPKRCERLAGFLDERADIELVWGMVQHVRGGVLQSMIPFGKINPDVAKGMLKERNIINHNSAMHRRTGERWDTSPDSWLYADWLFWRRLLDAGMRFENVPWVGERFYVDDDSIGVSYGERSMELVDIFKQRSEVNDG